MMSLQKLYQPNQSQQNLAPSRNKLDPVIKFNDHSIELFGQNESHIIDKNIHIIGPPAVGKTVLIKSLLISVKSSKPLIFLIAPTNTMGSTWLPNFLWLPYTGSLSEFLPMFEKLQKKRIEMHTKYQTISYIDAILTKLDQMKGCSELLEQYNDRCTRYGITGDEYKTGFIKIIGRFLRSLNISDLKLLLTNEQVQSIKHIGRPAPKVIIVMDDIGDCTYQKEYNDLSIRFRHKCITMITITHSPSFFSVVARNACQVLILCTYNDFIWYNNKQLLNYKGMPLKDVITIVGEFFSDHTQRRFLVFTRDYEIGSAPFYYISREYTLNCSYYQINDERAKKIVSKFNPTILEHVEIIMQLHEQDLIY